MKKSHILQLALCLLLALSFFTITYANPDPLLVSWYVTISGTPIDGALLTIYWSTSPSGSFTAMPSGVVEDKIAGTYQNPVITGYWNPDHPHGMAVVDLHITSVNDYYFYVEIRKGEFVMYWPMATSIKPGDPSWAPVQASGSPSDYAATGNGFGNGPTTAYPTEPPEHPPRVPEFGLGIETIAGVGLLIAYARKRKRKSP